MPESGSLISTPPAGHKGPRAAILLELKRSGQATAHELAERLGTSLNAVRHHLKELQCDSLIEHERERRGVGAPVHSFQLTAAGEALFPRRYESLLLHLLDDVAARDGREAALTLLDSYFDSLYRRLEPDLREASPQRRLQVVLDALNDQGYMAEWDGTEEEGLLREYNCAVRAVADRFPEICSAESRFLARTLGAEVERRTCASGCGTCEYAVRFDGAAGDDEDSDGTSRPMAARTGGLKESE